MPLVSPDTCCADIESIFNSISRLLCVYKPEESVALVQALSAALASEAHTGHEQIRMKVLGNLFNNLEKHSPSRFDVFLNLMSLAGRAGLLDALTSQFPKIETWIREWNITISQTRTLYRKAYEVSLAAGKGKDGLEFLKKVLQTFEDEEGGDM